MSSPCLCLTSILALRFWFHGWLADTCNLATISVGSLCFAQAECLMRPSECILIGSGQIPHPSRLSNIESSECLSSDTLIFEQSGFSETTPVLLGMIFGDVTSLGKTQISKEVTEDYTEDYTTHVLHLLGPGIVSHCWWSEIATRKYAFYLVAVS